MNKYTVYIILSTLIISSIGGYLFLKKVYLDFEEVCELSNIRTREFRPFAYVFFHSQKEIDDFLRNNYSDLAPNTKKVKSCILSKINLDFVNYSYCIFYGRKVENMYHSFKTTYFDDLTPSYVKRHRSDIKCVFVTYSNKELNNSNGIFLYKVKKDKRLSGFKGL